MKWYEYKPADTMFFRGAEPMVAGMEYETTLAFPPSVSVISGAVRTAVLAQNKISISDYKKGDLISEQIGEYGKKAPFTIIGPFIKHRADYFIPAPYTWFTPNKKDDSIINIIKPDMLDSELKKRLGVKSSSLLKNWVKHDKEVKPIGGSWISLNGFMNNEKTFKNGTSIFTFSGKETSLYFVEKRTGIAIDKQRRVKQSQLYSSDHIRLKKDVSLIWGIDKECGLDPQGVLTLGGEQRFGEYNTFDKEPDFTFSSTPGDLHLALTPIPVNGDSSKALEGSGKIIYRGGWNLAMQFHKKMLGFYPVGSVFTENINNSCISFKK